MTERYRDRGREQRDIDRMTLCVQTGRQGDCVLNVFIVTGRNLLLSYTLLFTPVGGEQKRIGKEEVSD